MQSDPEQSDPEQSDPELADVFIQLHLHPRGRNADGRLKPLAQKRPPEVNLKSGAEIQLNFPKKINKTAFVWNDGPFEKNSCLA